MLKEHLYFFAFIAMLSWLNGHAQTAHTIAELDARTIDTQHEVGTLPGASGVSATGGSQYTIPLEVPPGTNGMQPALAFTYDSQGGNGVAGMGWTLTGSSTISRTGKDRYHDGEVLPFSYSSDDRFELDGQRLVLTNGTYGALGSTYDTEVASFAHVELLSIGGNDARFHYFKVISKDGMTSLYGLGWNDKVLSRDGSQVISWRLSRVTDPYGNYMQYEYAASTEPQTFESELMAVHYSGNDALGAPPFARVVFQYQERQDVLTHYVGGVAFRQSKLLSKVEMRHGTDLVRRYELDYAYRDDRASYLNGIKLVGADGTLSFNPTLFAYGEIPLDQVSQTPVPLQHPGEFDLFLGDFDGNGISDILAAAVEEQNSIRFHSMLRVYLNGATTPTSGWTFQMPEFATVQFGWGGSQGRTPRNGGYNQPTSSYSTQQAFASDGRGLSGQDFNGDGRDDILITTLYFDPWAAVNNPAQSEWMQVDGSGAWSLHRMDILWSMCTTGQALFGTPQNTPLPMSLPYFKSPSKFMQIGDFDADGKAEALVVFNDLNAALSCRAYLYGQEGWTQLALGTSLQTMSTIDEMQPGDFDGDGHEELMVFRDFGNKTYHALHVTNGAEMVQLFQGWFDYAYGPDDFRIWPGDLNGDGVTDYVAHTTNGAVTLTGRAPRLYEGVFPDAGYHEAPLDAWGINDYEDITFRLADLDGNGMSDILYCYTTEGTRFSEAYFCYGHDEDGPLLWVFENFSTAGDLDQALNVGDMNGDGRMDVLCSVSDQPSVFYLSFNAEAFERQLHLVSDGYCGKLAFSYVQHRSDPIEQPVYPLMMPGTAGVVISSITPSQGPLPQASTTYLFSDLRHHLLGRGTLGFMTIHKATAGVGSERIVMAVNAPYYVPLTRDSYAYSSIGSLVTHTHSEHAFEAVGQSADMRFLIKTLSTLETNERSGATKLSVNEEWDDHGNVTSNLTSVNGSLLKVRTMKVFGSYGPAQVLDRVESTTAISTREGQPELARTTHYRYDDQGGLRRTTEFPGSLAELTTDLERSAFGSITKTTTRSTEEQSVERVVDMAYDPTGRFPLSKTTWWDHDGALVPIEEKYTYDGKWGVITSARGSDGLTTLHRHDVFGREVGTEVPHIAGTLRRTRTMEFAWDVDPGTWQVYVRRISEPGTPTSEEGFDAWGRSVRKAVEVNSTGVWSTSRQAYNSYGQLSFSTEPHLGNDPYSTTIYEYDDVGAVARVENSFTGETLHTYDFPGDGVVHHTLTVPGNRVSSTKTDATGVVISAHDDGGDLRYVYDSWGNQIKVRLNGYSVATIVHDEYGRRSRFTDPNTGTIKYGHDAFGQLTYMQDAMGNVTTYAYDNLGRMIDRGEVEGHTRWTYFFQGGRVTNDPVRIVAPDHEVRFEYDEPYLRLTKRTDVIDEVEYVHRYVLDDHDRVIQERYPSNVVVDRSYTPLGGVDRIMYNGQPLFSEAEQDGGGRYVEYRLGALPTTFKNYDHGLPSRINTPGLQDLYMTWESGTADLKSRWDAQHGLRESFTYDGLDRLLSSTINTVNATGELLTEVSSTDFAYDGSQGESRGNLELKEDVGQLRYVVNKPSGAYNINFPVPATEPPAVISLATQSIRYNSFHKALQIVEDVDGHSWVQDYVYGEDHQRVSSRLLRDDEEYQTRIHVGNYEKQVIGGHVQELHYVAGPDGLCALLVTTYGNTKPYHVLKDHLNSIVALATSDANTWAITAEQSFDAWGRRRNPQTWTYAGIPSIPSWLYRGYTGHEHTEPFALINMNGRMYDPVNGRMLSADNYVQGGLGTQGFNRYSYAANNPMKYTDPTGDFVWFALAGALAGGYLGGAIAGGDGGVSGADWNPFGGQDGGWNENWWKGAVTGALIGAGVGMGVAAGVGATGTGFGPGFSMAPVSGQATGGFNILANGLITADLNMAAAAMQNGGWDGAWKSGLIGLVAGSIGGAAGVLRNNATAMPWMKEAINLQNSVTASLNGFGLRYESSNGNLGHALLGAAEGLYMSAYWGNRVSGAGGAGMIGRRFASSALGSFGSAVPGLGLTVASYHSSYIYYQVAVGQRMPPITDFLFPNLGTGADLAFAVMEYSYGSFFFTLYSPHLADNFAQSIGYDMVIRPTPWR